jgi:outer membrane protein W
MKTFMITTAVASVLATATLAEDFKSNEVILSAKSGNLELSLGTVEGKLNTVSTTANFANYKLGRFDTSVDATVAYMLNDTLGLELEYNLATALNDKVGVYGSAAVGYIAPTSSLSDGDVFAGPTVGATYTVTDKLDTFAEVAYAWNVSDDWSRTGGALEVGVDYAMTKDVHVTPSLVRTFDSVDNSTNLKLEVGMSF